ncbi:MAG: hypothetical protein GF317_06540 [Candidatus Lokiarchaeota archaeon]|nr:hypothetical protein [Candidatus Lokiarchaeota archaeon]MBD3199371.1 hypothetical protein [Candidatus Lokiarchaeota archaeon]
MEHKNLTLDYDENLINRILDDINNRYILLFLYIIRNDLFQDLNNQEIIDSYNRVLILDEIYKGNLLSFWDTEFIETAIDLGLIKNIRTIREFEQKDQDFIIRIGQETITIEQNTISVPADTLYLMINKKFKFLTRRNFNLAITRLKSVRCERIGTIHPFIYQIGENDYTISDDLYYILDQFGNIYQTVKIENTIENFYERFKEILEKTDNYIDIFDSKLNNKSILNKINLAIEGNRDIFKYLKEEKVELPDKLKLKNLNKDEEIVQKWRSTLLKLLNYRYEMLEIEKELNEIRNYYSGKEKKYSYLEFIEKISFNEENIVDTIRNLLVNLRKSIVKINEDIEELTKKELKLLNLDYERFIIMSS